MPVKGRHQIQLRPEEMIVIRTAVEEYLTTDLSELERAIAESTYEHLQNCKLH